MEHVPDPGGVRRRQRAMLVAGLLVAPFMLLDLLLPNGRWVALAGGGWTAAILLGAALQGARSAGPRGLGLALAAVGGVVAVLAKTLLTGGSASVFYPLFLALPLIVLAVAPDLPSLVTASGLASLAAGVTVRVVERNPPVETAYWMALSTAVMGLAVVGAVLVLRQQRRELAAERARVDAVEALAESERRRAEAERYAEVGRLAATVSHEMNNPLASVAANLRWLSGAEVGDATEQRAVVQETLQGVDRLAEVLREIRKISHAAEADEAAATRGDPPPRRGSTS